MRKTCNYFERELDILKPDILIVFGNVADKYLHSKIRKEAFRFSTENNMSVLKLSNGDNCKYFKFPHPVGPGKYSWKGKDIEIADSSGEPDRTFEPNMKQKNKLFNYISYVVKIAQEKIPSRNKDKHNF